MALAKNNNIICIMGPTASGKTDLANALAQRIACEIISVDSALVYRGMDIGTAKPTLEQQQPVPHHLIDCCSPSENFSSGQFCDTVNQLIPQILDRGNTPLLVGGTMLYFNALLKGMATLPQADAAIRQQLMDQAQQKGWAALHEQLKIIDYDAYKRIHPHDQQRIQRALEVWQITGESLSSLQKKTKPQCPYNATALIVEPQDRALLHARIAHRFEQMLENNFIKEVSALKQVGNLTADMPSMRCVGYRQVWAYLEGKYDLDSLREKGIAATRQLAKRQLTWLRQWSPAERFSMEDPMLTEKVMSYLKNEGFKL